MGRLIGFADLTAPVEEGARVLVVDDDPAVRGSLNRVVTELGYDCSTAGSAEEADHWLRSERFEAVVLDIELPRMNGLEFLKWALGNDPLLAVIMLTGRDAPQLAIDCLDSGARTFFVKPFNVDFLGRALRDALQVRRLLLQVNALGEDRPGDPA